MNDRGTSSLVGAADWLTGTLVGSLAIGLCIIAVAVVGLGMLEGRLPVRHGARVILGCFVLLGAPTIAGGFMGVWQGGAEAVPGPVVVYQELSPREEPPPSTYDPYAGASLRRN